MAIKSSDDASDFTSAKAALRMQRLAACVRPQPASFENLDTTPVIVGVARCTPRRNTFAKCDIPSSPLDLMESICREAVRDTGLPEDAILHEITTVGCAGFFLPELSKIYPNMPRSLSNRLGLSAGTVCHQRSEGGDGAQAMTNLMADRVLKNERGANGVILLSRALAVDSLRVWKQNHIGDSVLMESWGDDPCAGKPEYSGASPHRYFVTKQEHLHGLSAPIHMYPLIENALRHKYGRTIEEHQSRLGELMSSFSAVAAKQPEHAWHPIKRTPAEISTPSASNRLVGFPYTKYMNADDNVDGAAAWLLCSAHTARRLGINEDKWVFLQAGAQCHEGNDSKWFVSSRADITEIPSMVRTITRCLASAGIESSQVKYFDLYSCFPCVVEIAADILGIAHDDPRGFTITGGLPFYGQMSSTCAIPAMVQLLREDRSAVGLVTGNGGFATKHSAGLYSGMVPSRPFSLSSIQDLQAEVDAMPAAQLNEKPEGAARIETFTVQHARDNRPSRAVIFGRLLHSGERFIAVSEDKLEVYNMLESQDVIGRCGQVVCGEAGKPNLFICDS